MMTTTEMIGTITVKHSDGHPHQQEAAAAAAGKEERKLQDGIPAAAAAASQLKMYEDIESKVKPRRNTKIV